MSYEAGKNAKRPSGQDGRPERASRVEGSLFPRKCFNINTYEICVRKSFNINTYKNKGLKVLYHQHLQERGWGWGPFSTSTSNRPSDQDGRPERAERAQGPLLPTSAVGC